MSYYFELIKYIKYLENHLVEEMQLELDITEKLIEEFEVLIRVFPNHPAIDLLYQKLFWHLYVKSQRNYVNEKIKICEHRFNEVKKRMKALKEISDSINDDGVFMPIKDMQAFVDLVNAAYNDGVIGLENMQLILNDAQSFNNQTVKSSLTISPDTTDEKEDKRTRERN